LTQKDLSTATPDSTLKQVVALILFVGIPQTVGFVGSLLTQDETDGWYEQADRAPWTPPDAVFGPVWTVLYISMGVAAWLVWRKRHTFNVKPALSLFVGQLVLNSIWSPLFFAGYPLVGTSALWAAMVLIIVLIVAIAATVWRFLPISRLAGILLLPYLTWTVYASTLNLYIALMN
jgi:translocator protein